ncbi:hypothetical protein C3L33_15847, partial [Rhododendron williamsianum]
MSTLLEAYKDDPVQLHHLIPLDFPSLRAVPESHVWPESYNFRVSPSDENLSIPIVDLKDPNIADNIGRACQTWGIFQVTNHGLPSGLLEDVEYEARRLFSLPVEQKRKVLRSPCGATGYGCARITPFFPKLMWHEGFTVMGSSVDHARVLWPHGYKRFCDAMDKYQKHMKTLAHNLFLTILSSLDLSEPEKNWAAAVYDSDSNALQLNSYPACPDPTRTIGLAPHTDSLLLTILHCETNGLQTFRDGFGWVPVHRVSGALTVNVGDLLHILSNGKFPTVCHQAVVNRTRHRISVAYFYGPRADSVFGPFSRLGLPRYWTLTLKEYIGIKAKHLDKALSFITN